MIGSRCLILISMFHKILPGFVHRRRLAVGTGSAVFRESKDRSVECVKHPFTRTWRIHLMTPQKTPRSMSLIFQPPYRLITHLDGSESYLGVVDKVLWPTRR